MIAFKQPIELRPEDPDNCVISTDPDGVYFRPNTGRMSGTYQIIIIGPMDRTPGEYAAFRRASAWVHGLSRSLPIVTPLVAIAK
jgi:hypothetical protein